MNHLKQQAQILKNSIDLTIAQRLQIASPSGAFEDDTEVLQEIKSDMEQIIIDLESINKEIEK